MVSLVFARPELEVLCGGSCHWSQEGLVLPWRCLSGRWTWATLTWVLKLAETCALVIVKVSDTLSADGIDVVVFLEPASRLGQSDKDGAGL